MNDRINILASRSPPISEPSFISKDESPLKLKKLAFLNLARFNDFLDRFDDQSVEAARAIGADILVFCDRPWMGESLQLPLHDAMDIALLSFDSFDDWFSSLPKNRRRQIRNTEKEGIDVRTIEQPSISEAQEILDLYQESPFREGRYFVGYHTWSVPRVMEKFRTNDKVVSSVAIYDGKIVGVAKAKFKGQVAVSNSILSSLAIRRKIKGVATSLLANQIKKLSSNGVRHIKYGHLGVGLEGLDHFKTSNGFRPVTVNYNYLLLTRKARLCARFGLYQPWEIIFSTKLRPIVPLLGSLQPHIPVKLIQKFHLYA